MQEPTSLWQLIVAYKKEFGYSALTAFIAVICSWHRKERGREIFFNGIMAGFVGLFIEDLISVFGLPGSFAKFSCIMVGYIGATAIMDRVTERFPLLGSKKPSNQTEEK